MTVVGFFFLLGFHLLMTWIKTGIFDLRFRPSEAVDLKTGVSPELYPKKMEERWWRQMVTSTLDSF
jgi:hypothetical protein